VVGIVWNEPLLAKLGGEIREQADGLVAQIESGAISVPRAF
jgi:hypothetical protein